jgi:hypothetical protein
MAAVAFCDPFFERASRESVRGQLVTERVYLTLLRAEK